MMAISRREFLAKAAFGAATAGLAAGRGSGLRANPLGLPIGSQTYPTAPRSNRISPAS
jgi:hypothetical protein